MSSPVVEQVKAQKLDRFGYAISEEGTKSAWRYWAHVNNDANRDDQLNRDELFAAASKWTNIQDYSKDRQ